MGPHFSTPPLRSERSLDNGDNRIHVRVDQVELSAVKDHGERLYYLMAQQSEPSAYYAIAASIRALHNTWGVRILATHLVWTSR